MLNEESMEKLSNIGEELKISDEIMKLLADATPAVIETFFRCVLYEIYANSKDARTQLLRCSQFFLEKSKQFKKTDEKEYTIEDMLLNRIMDVLANHEFKIGFGVIAYTLQGLTLECEDPADVFEKLAVKFKLLSVKHKQKSDDANELISQFVNIMKIMGLETENQMEEEEDEE